MFSLLLIHSSKFPVNQTFIHWRWGMGGGQSYSSQWWWIGYGDGFIVLLLSLRNECGSIEGSKFNGNPYFHSLFLEISRSLSCPIGIRRRKWLNWIWFFFWVGSYLTHLLKIQKNVTSCMIGFLNCLISFIKRKKKTASNLY